MPDPNPSQMLWMSDTALPFLSTTPIQTVIATSNNGRAESRFGRLLDLVRLRRAVRLREQTFERNINEVGIGQPFITISERGFHCLRHEVIKPGRAVFDACNVEVVQNVQDAKRGHALCIRWKVECRVATIGNRDRFHPIRCMAGKNLPLSERLRSAATRT